MKAKAEALHKICTVVIDRAAAPQDLLTAFGQGRELQVHLPLELIEHEFLIRGRSLFSFENWEAILCLLQESGDAFTHLHEQGLGRSGFRKLSNDLVTDCIMTALQADFTTAVEREVKASRKRLMKFLETVEAANSGWD